MHRLSPALVWTTVLASSVASAAEAVKPEEAAAAAMQKAVAFFREQVSVEGGYLWRYSEDLKLREGETTATASMAWVQPPGTPSVGQAYLTAYERTQEKYLLDAAVETARALVKGQLHSGGWDYRIEFDPQKRKDYAYRVDGPPSDRARDVSTLDDNTTQSAVRFLMHVDQALQFKEKGIHAAAHFALESLLKVQYPNGAWPQRFTAPPKPDDFPVIKANYPESWPRTWPNVNYMSYYTLNDNAQADVIDTMFEAAEIYKDSRYSDAAKRGGDFLILAQMPDPQPAWAQQYNAQMQPAWARKFEPPAITGGESQGAIRILMEIYRQTGDKKYLQPIPRALDYLKKSELAGSRRGETGQGSPGRPAGGSGRRAEGAGATDPGGRLARFYELKTNKPLYFTKEYELVYTDNDLPTHYGFVVGSNVDQLRAEYERLLATEPAKLKTARRQPDRQRSSSLGAAAQEAIASLDSRGAWVETGRLDDAKSEGSPTRVISTRTFIRNLDTLSRFIAASK